MIGGEGHFFAVPFANLIGVVIAITKFKRTVNVFAVGIISAPGRNYISNSLDSFFREWPGIMPIIFEEPGLLNYRNHDKVIRARNKGDKPFGAVRNWFRALSFLLDHSDQEFLMICEDDIEWTYGSGAYVRTKVTSNWDQPFAVSPYCSEINRPRTGKGWRKPYSQKNWCGALSMILHREIAKQIRERRDQFFEYSKDKYWSEALGEFINDGEKLIHLDTAIGKILLDINCPFITHNPTLVLHNGLISSISAKNTEANAYRSPAL